MGAAKAPLPHRGGSATPVEAPRLELDHQFEAWK